MSAQVFMSYGTMVLFVMAALLHLACIRDRTIYLTRAGTTARLLMAGGLALIALRFGFVIWDHGQLEIPLYVLVGHACVALGMIVYDLHRFAPFQWMDTRPGSTYDSQLPTDRRRPWERRRDRRASSVHIHDEGSDL